MKLNIGEIHNIIESLEARREWIEELDDNTGLDDQLVYIKSALGKLKAIVIGVNE